MNQAIEQSLDSQYVIYKMLKLEILFLAPIALKTGNLGKKKVDLKLVHDAEVVLIIDAEVFDF